MYQSILDTCGNTPHVKVNKLFGDFTKGTKTTVWVKQERVNPMHNIKDRIAIEMIEDAEKKGVISPGKNIIIEATSGNTGIGLAMVGAVKGYEVHLVMPDSCSVERRKIFEAFGAKCYLAPREIGATGLVTTVESLVKSNPRYWWSTQFSNPSNWNAHIKTSAREIYSAFHPMGGLDVLIGCVGTGGHISACAQYLKQRWPHMKAYAIEPEGVDVLGKDAKGTWSPHKIMGMGPNFRPNTYLDAHIDEIIHVNSDKAWHYTSQSALQEGTLIGISSGACLAAVEMLFKAGKIKPGATVMTWNYDSGERYLSLEGLFPIKKEVTYVGLDLLKGNEVKEFHTRTNHMFAKL